MNIGPLHDRVRAIRRPTAHQLSVLLLGASAIIGLVALWRWAIAGMSFEIGIASYVTAAACFIAGFVLGADE